LRIKETMLEDQVDTILRSPRVDCRKMPSWLARTHLAQPAVPSEINDCHEDMWIDRTSQFESCNEKSNNLKATSQMSPMKWSESASNS